MSDGLEIRAARAHDLDAAMALWERHGSDLTSIPDDRDELERLLKRSPGALIVAEAEGRIAGVLIAAFDGHRGHMHRLTVDADCRGRGAGRALVEAGHQYLRDLGARRVDAIVGVDEEAAPALWRSAGYAADPPHLVRWARDL